ncbi:heme biosynthesis HemY N-terminal domain-containing protein [Rhodoferax sp. GW822-FHT02A01]|jgi:HemY protein|uniref:heme biosynthesis HemY N-terminal domain-containing protein n=1 Tax=Rhodoferax sp. GW822-FHT02A01 TaxID=3141537 RepID=UPI00315D23FD
MRSALWLMGLFAVAAALALFAGNNPGTVTLFWPPYRVDVSLNLFLLGLALVFVTLHLALRTLSAFFGIPQQARRWRLQQKERAIQTALLDSFSHLISGRYIRARKAAELVVSLEESVTLTGEPLSYADRLRALACLLAAESAHALNDRTLREKYLNQALDHAMALNAQELRDGVHLRAARWALDDREAVKSLEWLDLMPQGASRRTLALRLRFKAARMAGRPLQALEMARLLTKHRAFTEVAGRSISQGLAIEHLNTAHDPVQLQRAWDGLEQVERVLPDVALRAAQRLLDQGGEPAMSRDWLLPVWNAMLERPDSLNEGQKIRLVRLLESGFSAQSQSPDAQWLSRIESAQIANPRDAALQYLAGMVCMRLSLWGKAQQLLKQSLALQQDAALKRDAWSALAEIAEQRQDAEAATQAYRQALKEAARN